MKKIFLVILVFFSFVYADWEPNNSWRTANRMLPDGTSQGTVTKYGDRQDYYYFKVPITGTLMINVDASAPVKVILYKNKVDSKHKIIQFENFFFHYPLIYHANDKIFIKISYPQKSPASVIIYSLETIFIPIAPPTFKNNIIINQKDRDFKVRYKANLYGNMKTIGNTVLCPKDSNGNCISDPDNEKTNADLDLKYVDVDNNSSTYDSSKAFLDIPDDANITFVGFYSQGYVQGVDDNQTAINKILEKKIVLNFEGNYTEDFYPQLIDILPNVKNNKIYGYTYDTFKELDNLKGKKGSVLKGWVTAANIYADEGKDKSGLGNYGAWTLVVVYKSKNEKYRNITIFDGYKKVAYADEIPEITINLNGFVTPLYGDIDSLLSLFVGEGDKYLQGDALYFDNTDISHKDNDGKDNAFYSVITGVPERIPNLINNNGIDIQNYNIGTSGLNLLRNGQESATVKLTSTQDTYFPSMIGFATQIYLPKVCYKNLKYYDENGNEINQVEIGDKVMVKFDVINEANLSAKNVYVRTNVDNQEMSYIKNSTVIKNVLSNDFINIPDNTSKGNLKIEYNQTSGEWRVGILGDNEDMFLPYSENPDYLATLEYNFTVNKDGNVSIDYYTSYKYRIGNEEYDYNDILPKCTDFNNNLNVKWVATGGYDAWDTDRNINDRNISTKIVNKPFELTVASLNAQNNGLEVKRTADANVTIVDSNLQPLVPYQTFLSSQNEEQNLTFTVPKAVKQAKVQFKVCGRMVNGTLRLYPFDECQNDCQNENETSKCFHKLYSSDSFSIRPYKFEIIPNQTKYKAGDDINLTIKAVEYNSSIPAPDYNETMHIRGNSPDIEFNETKPGCRTGVFTGTNLNFSNGLAHITLHYTEISDLNLTVKEINGSEFANVDSDDTPWNQRAIESNSTILHIIPFKFDVTGSYGNFNGRSFTYLSNDLNMSSVLNLTIRAVDKNNVTTQNYNKNCYAQNFDINISHSIPSDSNIQNILYKEENETGEHNISKSSVIMFSNLSKNYFTTDHNGSAVLKVEINFPKNYRIPVNEFNFTVNDVNVSDVNGTEGNKTFDQNATFRYGATFISNITAYDTTDVNATVSFKYWNSNQGWLINKEHNNTYMGEVNLSRSYYPSAITITSQSVKEGVQKLNISSNKNPYSAKIHLAIPSWLWYHPLAKPYRDPSSTNLDCLTHPCMKVIFNKTGNGWAGVGTNSTKMNEHNVTINLNLSPDINATKHEIKKLNW